MRELTSDELNQVAGGYWFGGDDSFGCHFSFAQFDSFIDAFFKRAPHGPSPCPPPMKTPPTPPTTTVTVSVGPTST